MSKSKIFTFGVAIVFIVLILGLVKFYRINQKEYCLDFKQDTIQIGENNISIALAESSVEKTKGLGGCNEVPIGHRLYFPFEPQQPGSFWMKDMIIPIDIIWISNNVVIGIEHNVPPPSGNTTDQELPIYKSPSAIDGVLEVAAGQSSRIGIEIGDKAVRK